jgi:hypothetical protein
MSPSENSSLPKEEEECWSDYSIIDIFLFIAILLLLYLLSYSELSLHLLSYSELFMHLLSWSELSLHLLF